MRTFQRIGPWRSLIGLVATMVLVAGVSTAQTKPRVLQAGADAGPLHVVDVGGRLWITEGSTRRDFALPADSRIDALEKTNTGWVAAGHYGAGAGGELLILRQESGQIALLPPPPGREERVRGTPGLFVNEGRLSGVAWLEGTRQEDLEIRAARWTERGWSQPEIVSAQGPGAQLALQSATLGDGSWLLVWAAVDGEDDEIRWSLRPSDIEARWSVPRRVHPDNSVPDVTPTVVATANGALAAWSFFDGRDYRIKTAHFDGAVWSEAQIHPGRGGTDARLLRHDRGYSLVYRTVVPAAWNVIDFDQGARVRRRAKSPGVRTDLPALEWTVEDQPRLHWPQPAFHWPAESRELASELPE